MPVAVRCEAGVGQGQCPSDATVLRGVFALCDGHRLLPDWRLYLDPLLEFEDIQKAYNRAHPRANGAK